MTRVRQSLHWTVRQWLDSPAVLNGYSAGERGGGRIAAFKVRGNSPHLMNNSDHPLLGHKTNKVNLIVWGANMQLREDRKRRPCACLNTICLKLLDSESDDWLPPEYCLLQLAGVPRGLRQGKVHFSALLPAILSAAVWIWDLLQGSTMELHLFGCIKPCFHLVSPTLTVAHQAFR